jgi:hypothetical protein
MLYVSKCRLRKVKPANAQYNNKNSKFCNNAYEDLSDLTPRNLVARFQRSEPVASRVVQQD